MLLMQFKVFDKQIDRKYDNIGFNLCKVNPTKIEITY